MSSANLTVLSRRLNGCVGLIAERLLHVGTVNEDAKTVTDAYTVIIQIGAILAVVLVSWRRIGRHHVPHETVYARSSLTSHETIR